MATQVVPLLFAPVGPIAQQEPQHVPNALQTHLELVLVKPRAALDVQTVLLIQRVLQGRVQVQGAQSRQGTTVLLVVLLLFAP